MIRSGCFHDDIRGRNARGDDERTFGTTDHHDEVSSSHLTYRLSQSLTQTSRFNHLHPWPRPWPWPSRLAPSSPSWPSPARDLMTPLSQEQQPTHALIRRGYVGGGYFQTNIRLEVYSSTGYQTLTAQRSRFEFSFDILTTSSAASAWFPEA